jgi:alkylated DNA repair protein alkB family protein 8
MHLFSEVGLSVASHCSHLHPGKFLFLVCKDIEGAVKIKEGLVGTPSDLGGLITIKFVDAKRVEESSSEKGSSEDSTQHLPVFLRPQETGISGLYLLQDYISEEEEKQLILALDSPPPGPEMGGALSSGWIRVSKRKVQHFGYRFDYASRLFSEHLGPFPPLLQSLARRISNEDPLEGMELDQMTANDYPAGAGMALHIDTHHAFTGPVVSLSLGSHTTMEFKEGVGPNAVVEDPSQLPSNPRNFLLFLPRRSLLIMSGESRYACCHGITSKKVDFINGTVLERQRRVSVTFRKIRGFPCNCSFPFCCDSQKAPLMPSRIAAAAMEQQLQQRQASTSALDDYTSTSRPRLEQDHVLSVYASIASHFSSTRFAIWPKVKEFMESLDAGSIVADVGCGNGKYLGVRSDVVVLGFDSSIELVTLASRRLRTAGALGTHFSPDLLQNADVFVADALSLPFRHSSFDSAISIAVLHHISSEARRIAFLSKVLSILKPGGRALVTVWSTVQEEPEKTIKKWKRLEDGEEGDFLVPWHVPLHRAEASGLAKGNQKVDLAKNTVVFERYYHLFTDEELIQLAGKVLNAKFISCFYDKSNWCLTLERTAD